MHIYKAYTFCIHSELLLPELITETVNPKPDIVIRFGSIPTPGLRSDGGRCFIGEVADVGHFLVQNGCEIIIDPHPGVDEGHLRTILLGPILSTLLRQRGLLVLHASSIAIDNGAIAFMGGSGWGKSTLAGTFHAKGYCALTDDVMAIDFNAGRPMVLPGFPQFKLCPQSATSIGHNANSLSPISPEEEKLSYRFSSGFQSTPLPLQRIYVLAKGTQHCISQLPPQVAFAELVRHSRAVSLLTAPEFIHAHFRQCSQMLQFVAIRQFTRKPSLMDLPKLVKMVETDLALNFNQPCEAKCLN